MFEPTLLALLLSAPVLGQTLVDQLALVTHPGAGANGHDVSEASPGTPLGLPAHDLPTHRVADEFTVTTPAGWRVTGVSVWVHVPGGSTVSSFFGMTARFWNGPPGAAGSQLVGAGQSGNTFTLATFAQIFRIPSGGDPLSMDNPCFRIDGVVDVTLRPGTYWLEWDVWTGALGAPSWAPTNPGPSGNALSTLDGWLTTHASSEGLAFQLQGVELGLGTNFCSPGYVNSLGLSAMIGATGSAVAADNDLRLIASQLPPGEFGYFIVGEGWGFVPGPSGPCCFCINQAPARYLDSARLVNAGGLISYRPDLTQTPTPSSFVALVAGDTRYFQCWYRDSGGTHGSAFSDALEVQFM